MKKSILIVILCITSILSGYSHYVKNFPKEIEQPDGSIVNCYITGDEFHLRLHDENNYTLIEDPQTGFLVYAVLNNDELVSSGYRVGQADPSTIVNLEPGVDISAEKQMENRRTFWSHIDEPADSKNSPKLGQNDGTINNIVIFVRFSNQSEFTNSFQFYEGLFNKDEEGFSSMYRYFKDVSYGKTHIYSTFYPVPTGTTVLSYQDIKPRSYYQPYSSGNTNGYTESERASREHELLARAVDAVKSQIPDTINLDFNNDGNIDNICFIVRGNDTGSSLLWPHKWQMYTRNIYIHGKRVWTYNLQLENHVYNASTLCHEMFHTLGAPDLYRGSGYFAPVDSWDLMAQNENPPQSTTMYMKYKYGGWISEIPEIIRSGTYTLNNVWSETNNCFKIASPNSTGTYSEYFVVEYRNTNEFWDQDIPGTGMLIYRINPRYEGNYNGPPDEVYIFRYNGTYPNSSGYVDMANFSAGSGMTSFNDNTNPPCFLTDGSPGGISIFNVTQAGSTISFSIEFDPFLEVITQNVSFGNISVDNPSNPRRVYFNTKYLEEEIAYNITGADAAFFSVDDQNLDPYLGGNLGVTFSPNEVRDYSATLEIVVDGFNNVLIPLTGTGIIIPVVANFSVNSRVVWAGGEVSFTDLSTGTPDQWNWTFEGGTPSTSTERNPAVKYNTPGTYNVTLQIANSNTNDQIIFEDYISVEAESEDLTCNNSFEYWTSNKPDCWFGETTTFTTSFLTRSDNDAYSGQYHVELNNTYNAPKRFSSKPLDVEDGSIYKISFYARGEGEIFTSIYDEREGNSGFSPNNPYIKVKSTEWEQYTQYVKARNTTSDAEFVFSVRNAVYASGYLMLDMVSITKLETNTLVLEEIDVNNDVTTIKACIGEIESNVIQSLPATILLGDNLGQTHSVNVAWNINNFNGNVSGTYTARGTFTLPDYLEQSNPPASLELTTNIIIVNNPVVTCPSDMTVGVSSITELTEGVPAGGIYSGEGVSDNKFYSEGLDIGDIYEITYTYTEAASGCTNSCNFNISIGIDVSKKSLESVKVYPNPSDGILYIDTDQIIEINIYAVTGVLILEKEISGNTILDLRNYSKGIYMLSIKYSNGNVKSQKLIIQ